MYDRKRNMTRKNRTKARGWTKGKLPRQRNILQTHAFHGTWNSPCIPAGVEYTEGTDHWPCCKFTIDTINTHTDTLLALEHHGLLSTLTAGALYACVVVQGNLCSVLMAVRRRFHEISNWGGSGRPMGGEGSAAPANQLLAVSRRARDRSVLFTWSPADRDVTAAVTSTASPLLICPAAPPHLRAAQPLPLPLLLTKEPGRGPDLLGHMCFNSFWTVSLFRNSTEMSNILMQGN